MARQGHRIEPYLQRLYRYGFSLARDDDRARDLVQECVVKALAARRTPDDEPAYRAWLFRILRNAFLDRARRERTAAGFLDPGPVPEGRVEFWDGDERFISGLDARVQMARLAAHHREILALIATSVHRASLERAPLDSETRMALATSRAQSPSCMA